MSEGYRETANWQAVQRTNHGAKGYAFTGGEHFRHRPRLAVRVGVALALAGASWAAVALLTSLVLH